MYVDDLKTYRNKVACMSLATLASSTVNQSSPSPVGAYLPTSNLKEQSLWATERMVTNWKKNNSCASH